MPTAFAIRFSSSIFRNSSVTIFLFSLQSAVSHLLYSPASPKPSPCRPKHTLPTISLCLRRDVASFTAFCTAHFLPVERVTPALRTHSSLEVSIVIAIRALLTLNSSVKAVNGSCSFVSLPYNPMFVKDGGIPSHFRKLLLILLSIFSTADIGTSYIISGHRIRGSTPCW